MKHQKHCQYGDLDGFAGAIIETCTCHPDYKQTSTPPEATKEELSDVYILEDWMGDFRNLFNSLGFDHVNDCGEKSNFYRMIDFIRSLLATKEAEAYKRGREEEQKAWLRRERCEECGTENFNEMSSMCAKCLSVYLP